MASSLDPKVQLERLLIEAQQLRAKAIRSRIMTAQTFCAIVETEARIAPERARHTLAEIRQSIDEIEYHISEPNHTSFAAADELMELLSALKARTDLIERSL